MKNIMRRRRRTIRGLRNLVSYCECDEMVMVEIGSYIGESTCIFAETGKFKKIMSVDPWVNGYDKNDFASHGIAMGKVEAEFDRRTSKYDNIEKYKMTGDKAVDLFEDGSLDIVYIDGCHTYEAVKNDIKKWLPKIKEGGYISGHDWSWKQVKRAILEELGNPEKVFSDSSWIFRVTK